MSPTAGGRPPAHEMQYTVPALPREDLVLVEVVGVRSFDAGRPVRRGMSSSVSDEVPSEGADDVCLEEAFFRDAERVLAGDGTEVRPMSSFLLGWGDESG